MDDAFSEEGSAQPRHDAQRPALAPRSDGFDIHTYHPDFVADPYPLLRLIRSRAPVCRDQALIWWISRYADVSACLRDRRFSADPARLGAAGVRQGGASWFGHQQLQPLARFYDNFMLFNDAPRHTRLRRLFAPAFGPDAVRRWEARIEVLVEELLDSLLERREPDLLRDFAEPLTIRVAAELFGFPREDTGQLLPWGRDLAAGLDLAASHGDAGQINRSAAAFSDYLQRQARGWSDGSSRPPSGAAPSILDGAAMLEAGLGLEDLVAAYAMVFMAAFETTISMVGNATLALLTHPDQLDLLRGCPELAANAVEELLRFDGAVRGGVRCTLEEVEIGGQRIPPGEKVWLSFLAANRDPEMFAAPDRLQLQRANAKQHVAFAHGPHYCLGAYLARLELQCALRGLVRRRFALASEPTDLRWRRSSVFRTLERLPIVPEGDAQKTCE
ncbi:cytochrome P450 [Pseudomonas aeruginosa]|uniref:cytochrome P450 n=1 Tax=Pseudomonas aeruginosa TaxID=287 RepID=UPI0004506BEF|nr:cytochrome P450 [Pseudomonas aeruginosa]ETU95355.1 cytochrome P450 [Pseudomonas aeruginosa PS42]MCO3775653.1 cytochrome P450 [Pseudomonas aeruginosa]MDX4002212.1 cytochrome P450 [Pseudomonas aeruginosa]RPO14631.1 cytochrome P450 [Pseudomonas aeruginosa]HBO0402937.1 cytochrome P450 [Pseudomonas aeruginosa]